MTADPELVGFCKREHPRLVGALSLYCGDAAVAEELAQEALYRACRDWPHVRGLAAPGPWVHRVAVNLANSRFRRQRAEARAYRRRGPDAELPGADPADVLAVHAALAQLPARQRQAVVLRHLLGFTTAEVAAVLGASEGAVKQLTLRGVTALRVALLAPDSRTEVPDG